jgi:protein-disulfide isomerase/uncharacterized membrane protein
MTGDADLITPISQPRRWIGLVCLAVATAASFVLVGNHLHLFTPPGCGAGSGCDRAARSVFGSVPVLGWPTSFVGMAYFLALGVAWIAAWRSPDDHLPAVFRNVVRAGAVMSGVFLVAMVAGGYACKYCILAHVGNFAFLAVLETTSRGTAMSAAGTDVTRRLASWGLGAFALVTGLQLGLGAYAESRTRGALDESIAQIKEATGEPFVGRYLAGPARAPIRIVIISDYQCPDCKDIESEIRQIMAVRSDVSVSAKHHPFSTKCNDNIGKDKHPNACWAARAAETSGILHGNDGFWKMHHWLFDREGSFTEPELNAALAQWGWDHVEFKRVMLSDETLQLVKTDIAEAIGLGLYTTPMVFINGVELRGWSLHKALTKAVVAVAATNPSPGDPSQDRPPTAREKYIGDWRAQPARNIPLDARQWTTGPTDATIRIVNWGDYQEPFTAKADIKIRALAASHGDVSYTFRHYPVNPACNPASRATFKHELACRAAEAAEAAGSLGGNDAYWVMHDWLMNNQDTFSDATLTQQARDMGLDPDALFREMQSVAIATEIMKEAAIAQRMGLRSIPFLFVNDKLVHRWNKPGLLEAIFSELSDQ